MKPFFIFIFFLYFSSNYFTVDEETEVEENKYKCTA